MLTDQESRDLLTFYMCPDMEPSEPLPFKTEPRVNANFEWLEFDVDSIKTYDHDRDHFALSCKINFQTFENGEIEISQLQFCQPLNAETINSVELDGIPAKYVIRLDNQTYKDYPIYKALFEKPIKYVPTSDSRSLCVKFKDANLTRGHKVAILEADNMTKSFTLNGKPITVTLEGGLTPMSHCSWSCLLALHLRYSSQILP